MIIFTNIDEASDYSEDGFWELREELLDAADYTWSVKSLRAYYLINEVIKLVDQQIKESGGKGA